MKQEDIDKKIGMPDVDAEWAKFDREVIGQPKALRKSLYWGIGIAASIALVAGIFLFGHDAEEPQQTIAQQTPPTKQIASAEEVTIESPVDSAELLAKVTHPTREEAADEALQGRIAGLDIVPTSEDLGPNAMRLGGIRVAGRDSVRIGRKTDYDFLVVVNGQALSEAMQKQMLSSGIFVYFYHRQQLVDSIYVYKDEDAKRPYVEKYGERAKTAVMVITTEPDTLCDAYVQQHLELKQIRHRMEGYVIDEETEKPLPDTWISYRDGAGAATDSTGHFILWLPRKDITLQASRVGYHTVRLNQLADTTLTIRMKDATKLKEVKATPKPAIRIY